MRAEPGASASPGLRHSNMQRRIFPPQQTSRARANLIPLYVRGCCCFVLRHFPSSQQLEKNHIPLRRCQRQWVHDSKLSTVTLQSTSTADTAGSPRILEQNLSASLIQGAKVNRGRANFYDDILPPQLNRGKRGWS